MANRHERGGFDNLFGREEGTMIVFLAIGVVGFIVLLLSLLIGELAEHGADIVHEFGDHDVDMGGDGAGDGVEHGHGGPSFFSLRMIAAFCTGFGGFGAIARYYDLSYVVSSFVGLAFGIVVGAIVYYIVRFLMTLQVSSNVAVADLVGKTATVEVFIPEGSVGKVSLSAKGATVSLIARSATGQHIPFGSIVTIKEMAGDIVVVEPREKEVRA